MKLPNKVLIASNEWKVIRSDGAGGCFDCQEMEIEVGKQCDDRIQFEIFLHEIAESILAENLLRFQLPHSPPDNGDYLFSFNHKDFEAIFIKQLAAILYKMVK